MFGLEQCVIIHNKNTLAGHLPLVISSYLSYHKKSGRLQAVASYFASSLNVILGNRGFFCEKGRKYGDL